MAAAAAGNGWTPYNSITKPPTNLKEAIDWVLRVTGKDGKKNTVATQSPQPPASPPQFSCLCFLAKAVKDLLYDARSPGSPGPIPDRYWDTLLLTEEQSIVKPVLTDLGLLGGGSTSAASSTCAGGTEVIRTLIDHLALGLQKWVGWQEGDQDECCLKGDKNGKSTGIGRECKCTGSSGGGTGDDDDDDDKCCRNGSGNRDPCASHDCDHCGLTPSCTACATGTANNKCYLSAYSKTTALWTTIVHGTPGSSGASTVNAVKAAQEVHLLARIFLGTVCLIWSGLSQLGFLTGGSERWSKSSLHDIQDPATSGLGSFMAAMGYDLERLNQGKGKNGDFVWKLLSGQEPTEKKNKISWQEFASVKDKTGDSVAEYYSSIYRTAQGAGKGTSEKVCEQYPLLVLHILASGYFRAGSAGAKGVTTPKAASSDPRKPRTIREILYWLSALPYSQGYRALVDRMGDKYPKNEKDPKKTVDEIKLYDTGASSASTTLYKDKITHYLLAACGYCPLVLIGIQGTINTSGTDSDTTTSGQAAAAAGGSAQSTNKKQCPKHKENRHKRCDPKDIGKQQAPAAPGGQELKLGEVCYGGYHLAVKDFGPLHGMYANGLFGFQMDLSAAQCLDQLRIYVYHCFYQLYFLRKQCKVAVLGWQSCRYGSGVNGNTTTKWICKGDGGAGAQHTQKCGLQDSAKSGEGSALQSFLCDALGSMRCRETIGVDLNSQKQKYPEIEEHMNKIVTPSGEEKGPHKKYPELCPVPMGWSKGSGTTGENHFKDLTQGTHKTASLQPSGTNNKYPAHCTGNTLSHLLQYYCDPDKCPSGTLVILLRLLACITPTVPRTLGDLFGFYYYIVYIGGQSGGGQQGVHQKLKGFESEVVLYMGKDNAVVEALKEYGKDCNTGTKGTLKCLYKCDNSANTGQCSQYLSPLSGQQYGQLSPAMAGTYLSWLVYLIEKFEDGLKGLAKDYRDIVCRDNCSSGQGSTSGCNGDTCRAGSHGDTCKSGGNQGVCGCASVVSCTGVLPVLYKYGFGYGNVTELHKQGGVGPKKCDAFLTTLNGVLEGNHLRKEGSSGNLHHEINQLIYTTRLPWIFVLTVAWLVAVLYLAFGAIWPLDWTHMRSHCRGWFRKGSLSPWEVLMVGKKKGRGILEFFGGR